MGSVAEPPSKQMTGEGNAVDVFAWPYAVAAAGVLVGSMLGYTARVTHFCTLSALERHWYAGDDSGLRGWVLVAAVALAATVLLQASGAVDVSASFYLTEPVRLAGAIVGGLMFGIGMALVGTCGFGALVRLGGGNMRALVVLTGMALAAIAAERGVTAHFRVAALDPLSIDLTAFGAAMPGTPLAVTPGFGFGALLGGLIATVAVAWCLSSKAFRAARARVAAAIIIGCCIAAGWFVTGHAATTGFEGFDVEAGSFVAPLGDTMLQIILVTGQLPDYGVGLMVGVFFGAAIAAWTNDDMRWEACDDARELGRHLLGAFLMGTGGVFALGCTIGQGVSAVSMLAVSAPVTIVAIVIGARLGLSYLIEGSPFAFLAHHADDATHPHRAPGQ